jgi:hypothetical protein
LIAFYRAAAAAVVVAHLAFVLFVVCGGVLVLRRRWVAWLHAPAAAWAVVVELLCPDALTRTTQLVFGTIALAINAVVYWRVLNAR